MSEEKRPNTALHALLWPVILLLGTLVVLALTIRLAGQDPLGALGAFAAGALGSREALAATAARSMILILYGLGIALSFRAGLLNIGAEGQSRIGAAVTALLATKVAVLASIPFPALAILLLGGAIGGALWSLIAGLLRVWRGVSEVVATLMLNFAGLLLVRYFLSQRAWLQGATIYPRAELPDALQLHGWSGTEFHTGVFIAIPVVLLAHIFLFHTTAGLHLRAMGLNAIAAHVCGVRTERLGLLVFGLSGALAGLAGALGALAFGALAIDPTYPGYGFTAIAVALVAGLKPLWVLPAGILFAALDVGAKSMENRSFVSHWIVYLVQGLIILAILVRHTDLFKARPATSAAEAAA